MLGKASGGERLAQVPDLVVGVDIHLRQFGIRVVSGVYTHFRSKPHVPLADADILGRDQVIAVGHAIFKIITAEDFGSTAFNIRRDGRAFQHGFAEVIGRACNNGR